MSQKATKIFYIVLSVTFFSILCPPSELQAQEIKTAGTLESNVYEALYKDADMEADLRAKKAIALIASRKDIIKAKGITFAPGILGKILYFWKDHCMLRTEVKERFTDNVLKDHDDKKSDFITRLKYKFDFDADFGKHRLTAGSAGSYELFYVYNSRNCLYYDAYIKARIFDEENKVRFRIEDTYANIEGPTGELVGAPIHHWYTNKLETIAEFDLLPKLTWEGKNSQYVKVFKGPSPMKPYDSFKYSLESSLFYKVTPKITVFPLYMADFINYYKGADLDSISQTVGGGIKAEMTPKSTINAKSGIFYRNYKGPTQRDMITNDIESVHDVVFDCEYIYAFSKNLTMTFTGKRDIVESLSVNNPYYINNSFTMGLNAKKQEPYIEFYLGGGYSNQLYPNKDRVGFRFDEAKKENNAYYAETKIEYRPIEWVSLLAEYMLEVRRSPHFNERSGYFCNEIGLSVRIAF